MTATEPPKLTLGRLENCCHISFQLRPLKVDRRMFWLRTMGVVFPMIFGYPASTEIVAMEGKSMPGCSPLVSISGQSGYSVFQPGSQHTVTQQGDIPGIDRAVSQRVTALMAEIKAVTDKEIEGPGSLVEAPRFLTSTLDTHPAYQRAYPDSLRLRRHWQELVALVGQQRYPEVETLAAVKDKKRGWFEMMITLHFAGYPTERYSNAQLGLECSPGTLGQNRVFCAVFDQLRACAGARTQGDFVRFASWLALLDIAKEYPNPWVTGLVQPWVLSMRSEFCQSVPASLGACRCPFDPCNAPSYRSDIVDEIDDSDDLSFDACYGFSDYYLRFQPTLLAILLSAAPDEFRFKAMQAWLTGEEQDAVAARKRLFQQRYYPLNTFFRDHYPWNALVMGITKDLPPPPGAAFVGDLPRVNRRVPVSLPAVSELSVIAPDDIQSAFGRTLKGAAIDGMQQFLKIQSAQESDADFLRSYQRLEWLHSKDKVLGLASEAVVPEHIFQLVNPAKLLDKTRLDADQQARIGQQIGPGPRLAMLFRCSQERPYDQYVYEVDDPAIAMEGLQTYARDYGRLWSYGLLGPAPINAYHDHHENRRHIVLPIYCGRDNEGAMERWNGHATNFPNVGGKVGMRDRGDIRLPEEVEEGLEKGSRDRFDPLFNNKIRLHELGRAAQGIVLLYARRFQGGFDHTSPESVATIVWDIGLLLTELFAHASPLGEVQCFDYLRQDGLLEQCARELSYWTAKDLPYVEDLRAGVINISVYPHLPKTMCGAILSERDQEFLTDKGFHTPLRDVGDEHQLGASSGRNFLIALNALIVKMLCHVVVASKVELADPISPNE